MELNFTNFVTLFLGAVLIGMMVQAAISAPSEWDLVTKFLSEIWKTFKDF